MVPTVRCTRLGGHKQFEVKTETFKHKAGCWKLPPDGWSRLPQCHPRLILNGAAEHLVRSRKLTACAQILGANWSREVGSRSYSKAIKSKERSMGGACCGGGSQPVEDTVQSDKPVAQPAPTSNQHTTDQQKAAPTPDQQKAAPALAKTRFQSAIRLLTNVSRVSALH